MPRVHNFSFEREFPVPLAVFARAMFLSDHRFEQHFHETVRGDLEVDIGAWDNDTRVIRYKPNVKVGGIRVSVVSKETQKRSYDGKVLTIHMVVETDTIGVKAQARTVWTFRDTESGCTGLVESEVDVQGNWLIVNEDVRKNCTREVRESQERWFAAAAEHLARLPPPSPVASVAPIELREEPQVAVPSPPPPAVETGPVDRRAPGLRTVHPVLDGVEALPAPPAPPDLPIERDADSVIAADAGPLVVAAPSPDTVSPPAGPQAALRSPAGETPLSLSVPPRTVRPISATPRGAQSARVALGVVPSSVLSAPESMPAEAQRASGAAAAAGAGAGAGTAGPTAAAAAAAAAGVEGVAGSAGAAAGGSGPGGGAFGRPPSRAAFPLPGTAGPKRAPSPRRSPGHSPGEASSGVLPHLARLVRRPPPAAVWLAVLAVVFAALPLLWSPGGGGGGPHGPVTQDELYRACGAVSRDVLRVREDMATLEAQIQAFGALLERMQSVQGQQLRELLHAAAATRSTDPSGADGSPAPAVPVDRGRSFIGVPIPALPLLVYYAVWAGAVLYAWRVVRALTA